MGICFGLHQDYTEASHIADRNFPYLPDSGELDGHPCQESGLFPAKQKMHPKISRRIWDKGSRMDRYFEETLLKGLLLPTGYESDKIEFFHDVSNDAQDGVMACKALGSRNRWAIIAMDVNDMGAQHRKASEKMKNNVPANTAWLGRMSKALDDCCRNACRDGIQKVIEDWCPEERREASSGSVTILPVRPLLVGGDDIVVLCHVAHAVSFVQTVCASFEERSRRLAEEARKDGVELWPATNGGLTISAGILFAPVSLPLSSAIAYADALLASAKGEGRKKAKGTENGPTPACLDWESVTEGLIDTPHARRQRELVFQDKDIGETVELSRRPYCLGDLGKLQKLMAKYREIPSSIRHQVLEGLHAGYWDRQVFSARLGKNQPELMKEIEEGEIPEKPAGRWTREKSGDLFKRHTDVVDAMLLIEEDTRMTWMTA
jgi:hypothetical protein